jgi:hypothetical protein
MSAYRWYLSATALREYAQAAGLPLDDGGPQWAAAERALAALCDSARLAQDEGHRQIWRAPGPDRWELTVSTVPRPEGPLPQLVRVRRRGGRGKGHAARHDQAHRDRLTAAFAAAPPPDDDPPAPPAVPSRGGARPGAGAPRQDPAAARIVKSYRIHPATAAAIERAAHATGMKQGHIIDRLAAEGLP